MTLIEAAAREIARSVSDVAAMPLGDDDYRIYAEIITRHLFPVVNRSKVRIGKSYWFRTGDKTECGLAYNERGFVRNIVNSCDEIRGPIPQPGVRP